MLYFVAKAYGQFLDLKVKFIRKIETVDCKVITRVEPVNEYMAILYCTLILLLLGLLFRFAKWAVQKRYTASLERFYNLVKRKVGYEVRKYVVFNVNSVIIGIEIMGFNHVTIQTLRVF